jgi:tetratricopeptide (TPR) repeat protein
MPALIEGFSYDIFISYRQKDNRYDGWVTEFVDHLKSELASTFKEEISVYFDTNPDDGLLETHDVNASLKEKLKCLVFIPIISRTYCDPKSFAWEHEFKAFIEQASADRFGLKITLPGGNVSGRVLPVRIHDLDKTDIALCESLLGGVLRGVEFVYKSAGVNRPLRSLEDNLHDNLNHTIYRDQINKVALAARSIIEGMKSLSGSVQTVHESDQKQVETVTEVRHSTRAGFFTFLRKPLFLIPPLLLVFAVIFLFSGSTTIPFEKRDWIVITDFENTTGETVFDKSLYTAFCLAASQSRYINILPRSRMMETLAMMQRSKDTFIDDNTGREIAARENIDIYIVPGISEVGGRYVIAAGIHNAKSGDLLRSEVMYADGSNEILAGIDQLSKKIRRGLGESRYLISTQDKPLSKVTTSSLEALKMYSRGIECHYKLDFTGARDFYESALRIDTGFTAAKASLGNLLIERFDREKGKVLLSQAVRSVENLTEKEKYGILGFYAVNVENDLVKGIEYTKRLTDLYPDDPAYHNNLGWYYQIAEQYEDAVREYKAAVKINPHQALSYGGLLWVYLEKLGNTDSSLVWAEKMISDNPLNAWAYAYLGSAWLCADSLGKAEAAFEKAREIDPKFTFNLFRLAFTYTLRGKYNEAEEVLKGILSINPAESTSAWYDLGAVCQLSGKEEEARKYLSQYRKYAVEVWIKDLPDDANTYISIAKANARLGDPESSKQMLQKAVGIDSSLHAPIAEVLCLQGRIPEALDQVKKALENGYRDLAWLKMSPDLFTLQYDVRFRKLLDEYFKH